MDSNKEVVIHSKQTFLSPSPSVEVAITLNKLKPPRRPELFHSLVFPEDVPTLSRSPTLVSVLHHRPLKPLLLEVQSTLPFKELLELSLLHQPSLPTVEPILHLLPPVIQPPELVNVVDLALELSLSLM